MQKSPKILNYKNLIYEKYEFGQPYKNQNGTYQSVCNYRLSKNEILPFYFETPKLKTPTGIVKIENKYYMDLELPQTGDASSFYNFILKTDEHNISMCHQNSKDWFNQFMPLNIIENYYKSPIILKTSGQLPVMRVRLPSYKGNILTEIFNIKKEKINDILCIQENDFIVGILEFTGLSFLSQSFSPMYELQKIKIFKENEFRTLPSGYIFSDINDKIELDKIQKITIEDIIMNDQITTNNTNSTSLIANLPTPDNIPISIPISIPNTVSIASNASDKSNHNMITDSSALVSNQSINNNNTNIKTLFDMIKQTTLKDIINDNDIFVNHSKFLLETQKKRENIIKQFNKIKETEKLKSQEVGKLKIENMDDISLDISITNKAGIQKIAETENNLIQDTYANVNTNENADADGIDADGIEADADGIEADADGIEADADGIEADADGIEADADGI